MAKLAQVLIDYSVDVKSGDRVLIQGDTPGEPLIVAAYEAVLRAGGHPPVWAELPGLDELLSRYGSEYQLRLVPEPIKLASGTDDVHIYV